MTHEAWAPPLNILYSHNENFTLYLTTSIITQHLRNVLINKHNTIISLLYRYTGNLNDPKRDNYKEVVVQSKIGKRERTLSLNELKTTFF